MLPATYGTRLARILLSRYDQARTSVLSVLEFQTIHKGTVTPRFDLVLGHTTSPLPTQLSRLQFGDNDILKCFK
jgi:hypothetical protein